MLPLPEPCVQALAEYRLMVERWRQMQAKPGMRMILYSALAAGLPLDPRNFHRRFKVKARKAGVPAVTVHSTRDMRLFASS